jgi:putative spermidine/putrescine transport system permease protein
MKAGPVATAIGVIALVFLLLPPVIVVAMSFSSASSLQFPPPGLSLRWYRAFLSDPRWIEALTTSAVLALVSSTIALLLGGLAAYALARGSFRVRGLMEANFMAPLIVPGIVIAVALYLFLARIGLLGSAVGLLVSHVVVCTPFVVLVIGVGIRSFDVRIEQVAATLGASRWQTVTRVLLPNILPSAASAFVLAYIASFDEVVITLFVSGTYQTVPKRMFNELVLEVNPTITAIATVMIGVSLLAIGLAVLAGGRRYIGGAPLREMV